VVTEEEAVDEVEEVGGEMEEVAAGAAALSYPLLDRATQAIRDPALFVAEPANNICLILPALLQVVCFLGSSHAEHNNQPCLLLALFPLLINI